MAFTREKDVKKRVFRLGDTKKRKRKKNWRKLEKKNPSKKKPLKKNPKLCQGDTLERKKKVPLENKTKWENDSGRRNRVGNNQSDRVQWIHTVFELGQTKALVPAHFMGL